jgi:hypothetical protein
MSIIFYDHLTVIQGLDKKIKKISSSNDEEQELWKLVEEIIHTKVFDCCLGNLPEDNHDEFLKMFFKKPHDKGIIKYLNEKIGKDVEKMIKNEMKKLSKELLFLNSDKM